MKSLEMQGIGGGPRVLVIEPNRNYLAVLVRRLGEAGYRIATADSATAGVAEMYRIPVDIVLCEASLPGTSGIEFARMVREDPMHRDLPLLLIVGRSNQSAAVSAFQAGADGVVRKPCHFEILEAAIARLLERADALKRLVDDNAALDAKVISRAIELREVRDQLNATEYERQRLAAIVGALP